MEIQVPKGERVLGLEAAHLPTFQSLLGGYCIFCGSMTTLKKPVQEVVVVGATSRNT